MVISLYEGGKMNSVENYAIRYLEPKDVKDLDQYNAAAALYLSGNGG